MERKPHNKESTLLNQHGQGDKMHPLEEEIRSIAAAFKNGELSLDESNYLLQEIRDIRAAQECADNEEMFR